MSSYEARWRQLEQRAAYDALAADIDREYHREQREAARRAAAARARVYAVWRARQARKAR